MGGATSKTATGCLEKEGDEIAWDELWTRSVSHGAKREGKHGVVQANWEAQFPHSHWTLTSVGELTILVYDSGLILEFSGPKAYTILLKQRYIPPAINAGAIVKHTICIRNPSWAHWFCQLSTLPTYPTTSSVTPHTIANVKPNPRRVTPYVTMNPRRESEKSAKKVALAARETR